MPKTAEQLLDDLARKANSSPLSLAKKALTAHGFELRKSKGNTSVWRLGEITLTLHRPHSKHMKPSAVREVVHAIRRATKN